MFGFVAWIGASIGILIGDKLANGGFFNSSREKINMDKYKDKNMKSYSEPHQSYKQIMNDIYGSKDQKLNNFINKK